MIDFYLLKQSLRRKKNERGIEKKKNTVFFFLLMTSPLTMSHSLIQSWLLVCFSYPDALHWNVEREKKKKLKKEKENSSFRQASRSAEAFVTIK